MKTNNNHNLISALRTSQRRHRMARYVWLFAIGFLLICMFAAHAADYTVTIEDKPSIVALTMAREAYNAARAEGSDGPFDTDADYFAFRVKNMLSNLAQQMEIDVPALTAKRDAIDAKLADIAGKSK